MSAQHTPGRLSQGVTLLTAQTRRWTPEEVARNDETERRMLFAGFSVYDEGRSRVRIAICDREEDARRLKACWNACEGISTEALERGPLSEAFEREQGQADSAGRQRDELLAAIRAARRTAQLMHTQDGHEVVCIEPHLWAAIIKATGGAA